MADNRPSEWTGQLDTPLGLMGFQGLGVQVQLLWFECSSVSVQAVPKGAHDPVSQATQQQLIDELGEYFSGLRQTFDVALAPRGTAFQQAVWQALLAIPYGQTISYSQQADAIGRPRARRAVANANGANPLPILIPCHRVIAHNGALGGYGPGVCKKEWLIQHESINA